ncbi:MAG: hypothetical protein ABMA26_15550 [Limisphaerales bacterium]
MLNPETAPLLACMAGFKLSDEQMMLILAVLTGWGAIFIIAPINLYLSLVPPKGAPDPAEYRRTHLTVCAIGVAATAYLFYGARYSTIIVEVAFTLIAILPLYGFIHYHVLRSQRRRWREPAAPADVANKATAPEN